MSGYKPRYYRNQQPNYANPTISSAGRESILTEEKRRNQTSQGPTFGLKIEVSARGRDVYIPTGDKDRINIAAGVHVKTPRGSATVRMGYPGTAASQKPYDKDKYSSPTWPVSDSTATRGVGHGNGDFRYMNRSSKPATPKPAYHVRLTCRGDSLRSVPTASNREHNRMKDDQGYIEKHNDRHYKYPVSGSDTGDKPLSNYSPRSPSHSISPGKVGTKPPADIGIASPSTTWKGESTSSWPQSANNFNEQYGRPVKSPSWSEDNSREFRKDFEGSGTSKSSAYFPASQLPQNRGTKTGANISSRDAEYMYQQQLSDLYLDKGPSFDTPVDNAEHRNDVKPRSVIGDDNVIEKLKQQTKPVETCSAMYKSRTDSVEKLLEETFADQSREPRQFEREEKEEKKGNGKYNRREDVPKTTDERTPGGGHTKDENRREPVSAKDGNKREPVVNEDWKGARPKQNQTDIKVCYS